ncbi:SMI1/KNR4 family protein [Zobellia sp. 1_MG-2023]|uniref:SMI1/KNR4 family protein n=1 Tax=Zobellia sp. 1_MG-2023 TaxID=3062626 RepID=UPI0026E2B846|nr:SMI1/KNR4 family protein [Zobellia sp. 1_MG-2023]MDO6819048.1 SMI1/KNR4 family protein [Zobellia sp. 1_MG-2023]
MKINKFKNGDIQNIIKVESTFNIKLPSDYKLFLKDNNGAAIHDAYFFVKDLKQKIMMGVFYGIDLGKENESIDILYQNKEFEDDILTNSLLIGSDPGGAWLLLIFDGENDGVWYYDHSNFFDESTDDLNTYYVAESFSDFIKMLEITPPPHEG